MTNIYQLHTFSTQKKGCKFFLQSVCACVRGSGDWERWWFLIRQCGFSFLGNKKGNQLGFNTTHFPIFGRSDRESETMQRDNVATDKMSLTEVVSHSIIQHEIATWRDTNKIKRRFPWACLKSETCGSRPTGSETERESWTYLHFKLVCTAQRWLTEIVPSTRGQKSDGIIMRKHRWKRTDSAKGRWCTFVLVQTLKLLFDSVMMLCRKAHYVSPHFDVCLCLTKLINKGWIPA